MRRQYNAILVLFLEYSYTLCISTVPHRIHLNSKWIVASFERKFFKTSSTFFLRCHNEGK